MMDLQKEREAFEKEMLNSRYVAGNISAFWDKKTQDYDIAELRMAWHAWQAAKAQAVPKGFVLVSVDTLEECLNWADIAKWDSSSNEADKKIAHHEAIIESAISAQEPTND